MAAAYEDNFGFWNIDGPRSKLSLEHVQRQSVPTICQRCERPVRLMPAEGLLRHLRLRSSIKAGPASNKRISDTSSPKNLKPRNLKA